jgi:ParB family transcriptional regulator, chromosome partitioning protein
MERKVLGRGLDALITPTTSNAVSVERVQTIKISQIHASRFQPRLHFNEEKIQDLARSIREKGIVQPLLVRAIDVDRYELIAGERRLRAAAEAGLQEVPVIVRRVADADVLETAIVENVQREDLNPLDEAKAYRRLAQEFGFSQDQIAQKVGKDKSSISNMLRVLNLPEAVQDFLWRNLITLGHAKALLMIGDEKRQIALCEEIVKNGLSVRQMETIGSAKRSAKRKSIPIAEGAVEIKALESDLQHALGTKVRILHGKKRGKIEIEYYSLDDLDRVLKLLGVQPK